MEKSFKGLFFFCTLRIKSTPLSPQSRNVTTSSQSEGEFLVSLILKRQNLRKKYFLAIFIRLKNKDLRQNFEAATSATGHKRFVDINTKPLAQLLSAKHAQTSSA